MSSKTPEPGDVFAFSATDDDLYLVLKPDISSGDSCVKDTATCWHDDGYPTTTLHLSTLTVRHVRCDGMLYIGHISTLQEDVRFYLEL